ncbi:MAG: hypothetical protein JW741_13410, partial [Sedimentisphaerales bacterium]|nr:hypothetical protein [Sedimentisphaerales bacterium]
ADFTGSDCRPELVVGRIIGNDAVRLQTPIETSLTFAFDNAEALVVSGTGKGESSFENNADDIAAILQNQSSVHTIHWGSYDSNTARLYQLTTHTSDRDVIYFRDHGGVNSWSPALGSGDVSGLDFGGSTPVVFGCACLTGMFENHPDPCFAGGDYCMAEAFLRYGAGVYIGSTETSPRYVNNQAGEMFFEYWTSHHQPTGVALRHIKKDLIDDGGCYKRRWVKEYNLYGDPKFGAYEAAAQQMYTSMGNIALASAEPVFRLDVSIPDYEIVSGADGDRVTFAGASLWCEPDAPVVPLMTQKVDYAPGYQVQDVALVSASTPVILSGLNLPIESMETGPSITPDVQPVPSSSSAWYPAQSYDWAVYPNPDGTSTLMVRIFPLAYNQPTLVGQLTQRFIFDIDVIESEATIARITTDQPTYTQADRVRVDMDLSNTGSAGDVIFEAFVKRYGAEETVAGLLLETLHDFSGQASFSPWWQPRDVTPGQYYIEASLRDSAGHLLERKTHRFDIVPADG